jgi:hypothetical protein
MGRMEKGGRMEKVVEEKMRKRTMRTVEERTLVYLLLLLIVE